MITIFCMSDINHSGDFLPLTLSIAVSQEISQLHEMLNLDEGENNLEIDTKGYTIVCLGDQEPLSNLSTIGLIFPFLHVEYVEIYDLHEVPYYRILLMYDNESFTTIFSLKGTQNTRLEEWLADQAIQGGADYQ